MPVRPSPRPALVTGLAAEPAIARTALSWRSLGFDPLIDHYRVHAVPGSQGRFEPGPGNLVAKTVYPQLVHHVDPRGETWTYRVLAVSDAGRTGRASDPLVASSSASVVATGRPVATIGEFDGRTLEHRFAPSGYAQIPAAYPDAVVEYDQGTDTPAAAWPYLLPGPGDAWAGRRPYTARWRFDLAEAPAGDHDLAVWLVDTTRLGGTLRVAVGGAALADVDLPPGGTRGSRDGDATVPGTALVRSYHELAVPAARLRQGANEIELVVADGGWVAWDAVGVFARA
ncbi:polysaccharide lyase family protein [Isoptericola cucumis]|uniref:polysaccharide lyase family protein n=1 Tax=Isoptericola cucumis TaxID=1776856 RepID=UPI003208CCA2